MRRRGARSGGPAAPDANRLYAMKVVRKAAIIHKPKTVEHMRTERQVLEAIRASPFLVALHYAFQTDAKLHLILGARDVHLHLLYLLLVASRLTSPFFSFRLSFPPLSFSGHRGYEYNSRIETDPFKEDSRLTPKVLMSDSSFRFDSIRAFSTTNTIVL